MNDNKKRFLPVTHESLVVDNDNINIANKYATKKDLSDACSDKINKTYLAEELSKLTNGASESLDTLLEIGNALNNDADFAGTMITNLETKVDKEDGKVLSSNDFTNDEKMKLEGLSNYDDTALRKEMTDSLKSKIDISDSKSLLANSEIERLKKLSNYDDTEIRDLIDSKVTSVEGMGLSSNDFTGADKLKLGGLSNYDDTFITTEIGNKVDKEENKSLMSDVEIARLSDVDNYDDSEIVAARDGEDSLKDRLDRDLINITNIIESVEDSFVSVDNTLEAPITNIEILGNTIQDDVDLSDIQSVGTLQEDGTYKVTIKSVGKNLFDGLHEDGIYNKTSGKKEDSASPIIRCTNFIPLLNNQSKVIKNSENVNFRVFFFDSDMNFIESIFPVNGAFESPGVAKFMTFQYTSDVVLSVQIEEGTVATEYEPYKENTCEITLPCQLEGIGNIKDRLYHDGDNWCIEKVIYKKYIDRISNVSNAPDLNTVYRYRVDNILPELKNYGYEQSLMSHLPFVNTGSYYTADVPHYYSDGGNLYLFMDKNIVDGTISDLVRYCNDVGMYIIYSNTPTKITLPKSTQIQLNSYLDKTHIYFPEGVEGTFKGTISKSLGASVKANTTELQKVRKEINDISNMKGSEDFSYESDKGYIVCENTNEGVVKDFELQGKTLVNLLEKQMYLFRCNDNDLDKFTKTEKDGYLEVLLTENLTSWAFINLGHIDLSKLKPNTVYTIVCEDFESEALTLGLNNLSATNPISNSSYIHNNVGLFTTTDYSDVDNNIVLYGYVKPNKQTIRVKNAMIIEGDHTQNPPSYFEGIKSVGEDVEKVEVESINGNYFKPIYEILNISDNNTIIKHDRNEFIFNPANDYNKGIRYFIPSSLFKVGVEYEFIYESKYITVGECWFGNENYQSVESIILTNKRFTLSHITAPYIQIFFKNSYLNQECWIKNIRIKQVSSSVANYQPHQSDTKQLSYINEDGEIINIGQGNPLREYDYIDNEKIYINSREVILNGSEDWAIHSSIESAESHIAFTYKIDSQFNPPYFSLDKVYPFMNSYFVNSARNASYNFEEKESMMMSANSSLATRSSYIGIKIARDKLDTEDVVGFKTWLQENPVTIVYELAEPKVYDLITPINLASYEGETTLNANSGAISPTMKFKMTSYITELIKSNRDRVDSLEDFMLSLLTATLDQEERLTKLELGL